jgi:hypothetical protein
MRVCFLTAVLGFRGSCAMPFPNMVLQLSQIDFDFKYNTLYLSSQSVRSRFPGLLPHRLRRRISHRSVNDNITAFRLFRLIKHCICDTSYQIRSRCTIIGLAKNPLYRPVFRPHSLKFSHNVMFLNTCNFGLYISILYVLCLGSAY